MKYIKKLYGPITALATIANIFFAFLFFLRLSNLEELRSPLSKVLFPSILLIIIQIIIFSTISKIEETKLEMNNEKALNYIKIAWISGTFSGATTLIFVIISILKEKLFYGVDIFNLLDALLTFGLTFGIYKKSRICSITLFLYFLSSKILMFFTKLYSPTSIILAFLFLYFYFNGIRGTIYYHLNLKSSK